MKGKVYIVGAGPGNEGLITVRGLECLREADCVIYDNLVNGVLLRHCRDDAELIDVGKVPGKHTLPQEKINCLLADKGRKGHCVVRLKGGDPYVFGRGGEEVQHLFQEGIPFEVIPGVTSAIAACSWAGIPVTHRGMSSLFTVVSGSTAGGDSLPDLDWAALSRIEGTVIFLMGMANVSRIVDVLVQQGKDPLTPAAVIMWATSGGQKVASGPLVDIPKIAQSKRITNPAVLVIGAVVDLRQICDWWEKNPLAGERIMVVGSRRVIDGEVPHPLKQLRDLGAEVLTLPLLTITPDRESLTRYFQTHPASSILVFLSRNAVSTFLGFMKEMAYDVRTLCESEIVAIGEQTARELQASGIVPDLVPNRYDSEGLACELESMERSKDVTLITSDKGGGRLEERLRTRGFQVEILRAYRNQADARFQSIVQREIERGINTAVFTSPSAFFSWCDMAQEYREKLLDSHIVAIGSVTERAIENAGFTVAFSPKVHTLAGLVNEWLGWKGVHFSEGKNQQGKDEIHDEKER